MSGHGATDRSGPEKPGESPSQLHHQVHISLDHWHLPLVSLPRVLLTDSVKYSNLK